MNIADMTDEELTGHVERLVKVVEEKNVFVGAILRAELDTFLRELQEGAKEAQSIPPLPHQWEALIDQPINNFAPGDTARIAKLKNGVQQEIVVEWGNDTYHFVLPRGTILVRAKPGHVAPQQQDGIFDATKGTLLNSPAVQGISISASNGMELLLQEMTRAAIQKQQEELMNQPPPITYNWDYLNRVSTDENKEYYRHTRYIMDELDEIQKRAKRENGNA